MKVIVKMKIMIIMKVKYVPFNNNNDVKMIMKGKWNMKIININEN